MLRFRVNLKGIDKGKKLTINKGKKVLLKSMFKMEELAISYAPVDRGFLRANISVFPQILANKYTLTSKASYSEDMEYGSAPKFVPIDDLVAWAIRKTGDGSLGFAAQKTISERGVRAHPFMRPAKAQVENFWLPLYWEEEFKK